QGPGADHRNDLGFAVGFLFSRIEHGSRQPLVEVGRGVDGFPVYVNFVVNVGAGTAARRPAFADGVPALDGVARLDQKFLEVRVPGHYTIAMIDLHEVSVPSVALGADDRAACGGQNLGAGRHGHVGAGVFGEALGEGVAAVAEL